MKKEMLIGLLCVCFVAMAANAALIDENFDAYTSGTLNGQGGWTVTGNGVTVGATNSPLGTAGSGAAHFSDSDTGANVVFSHSLTVASDSITSIKFDLNLLDNSQNPTLFLRNGAGAGAGNVNERFTLGLAQGTTKYVSSHNGSSWVNLTNSTLTALATDTWYHFEITITDTASNGIFDIRIFDESGEIYSATSLTARGDVSGIDRIIFGVNGGTTGSEFLLDNLKVEVIPEPSSVSLFIISVAVPFAMRRLR